MKHSFFVFVLVVPAVLIGCRPKPSKVDLLRMERDRKDSIEYAQAQQTLRYSDSLLQELLPQVDPLLKSFRYEKNEKVEDHGHYIHRLLQTGNNASRCFLQAYVSDDRKTMLQSYFFGAKPIHHNSIRLSSGDVFVQKEGSLHSFEAEGVHEIVSVQQDDARELLQFVAGNVSSRVLVTAEGNGKTTYYLQENEKQALAETYRLAVLMNDIAQLEQAIHTSSLQIQKYEYRRERREKGEKSMQTK